MPFWRVYDPEGDGPVGVSTTGVLPFRLEEAIARGELDEMRTTPATLNSQANASLSPGTRGRRGPTLPRLLPVSLCRAYIQKKASARHFFPARRSSRVRLWSMMERKRPCSRSQCVLLMLSGLALTAEFLRSSSNDPQDLAVKREGRFVLRYRIFNLHSRTRDGDVHILAECFGGPFEVYSTKSFPGLQASTELTRVSHLPFFPSKQPSVSG